MEVVEIEGFWVVGSNKWNKRDYSKKSALKMASTLVDCHNCVDCEFCFNCVSCIDCHFCSNCNNCSDCKYLECAIKSEGCVFASSLKDCQDIGYSHSKTKNTLQWVWEG